MSFETVVALTLAMVILAASPGPGAFATMAHSLSFGFGSTLSLVAGIACGDLLFVLMAVFGLSAMAQVLGHLFFVVKLIGGGWLIFLGVKIWMADRISVTTNPDVVKRSVWKNYSTGLFITMGNPKVILFYIGFLPTFIDISVLTFFDTLVTMGVVFSVVFLVLAVYAYAASRARLMLSSEKASKILNRSAGTLMIGAGILVAVR